MKFAVILTSLFLAACGSSDDGPVFIALQTDFADFRTWTSTDLGDAPLLGHPAGERTAFVKTPLPAGAPAYPIGDLIVKTVAVDPTDETTWDLFAMVKRGGGYNAGGARNWEFFLLKIPSAGGPPQITGRGADPRDSAGMRLGYTDPSGTVMACNGCHGAPGTEKTDYVLAPPLEPGYVGGSDGPTADGGT